ncbi:MAG TPA: hypothetical protein VMF65_01520 [Acidimicrobiales bacterium]|nr:hypothetical protein [Acidimicrobiales bacterium]
MILNTAVADELIVRNPCRVRGAGQDHSAERPIATVAQVADQPRAIQLVKVARLYIPVGNIKLCLES